MQISGDETFAATVEEVWNALHDESILKKIIPGCQSMELNEDGGYEIKMKLGIAAVKGEYVGKVKIDDLEKPISYLLTASGSGTPGYVQIKMDCRLAALDSGCRMQWDCNAEIGGLIASVGGRVLTGLAKFIASGFFKDLKKQLGTAR